MQDYNRLRDEARRVLREAKCATDAEAKQRLAERAFELAQRAEALERTMQGHPFAEAKPLRR